MLPKSFTSILFDLDGTLIDSIELILSSYHHTMERHRGEVPPDEVWLAGLGTPLWKQFGSFTDDPAEITAMVETYRTHNIEHHDRMVRRYPGVLEAVRDIKQRGAKLAVVTSKLRSGTVRGLAHCGFDGLFDALVCADDVEQPKPAPEPVLKALDLLGSEAGRTIFVGDSPHDLVSGKAAGVSTGAVSWGPFQRSELERHGPDLWISEARELVELVGR